MHAFFCLLPFCQHQNRTPDHLRMSCKIDCPKPKHWLGAFCQKVLEPFHAGGNSDVPTCHLSATNENNDRPFSTVAVHAATSATSNHFVKDRKYHSRYAASHVSVVDLFSLSLASMVGFSTIEYHSGRLGKFVVIWSSGKF